MCFNVLHCVAACCSVLQCVAVCCSVLQCVAVCCSVLQCAAVCCSVLQCVAVLQRAADREAEVARCLRFVQKNQVPQMNESCHTRE